MRWAHHLRHAGHAVAWSQACMEQHTGQRAEFKLGAPSDHGSIPCCLADQLWLFAHAPHADQPDAMLAIRCADDTVVRNARKPHRHLNTPRAHAPCSPQTYLDDPPNRSSGSSSTAGSGLLKISSSFRKPIRVSMDLFVLAAAPAGVAPEAPVFVEAARPWVVLAAAGAGAGSGLGVPFFGGASPARKSSSSSPSSIAMMGLDALGLLSVLVLLAPPLKGDVLPEPGAGADLRVAALAVGNTAPAMQSSLSESAHIHMYGTCKLFSTASSSAHSTVAV